MRFSVFGTGYISIGGGLFYVGEELASEIVDIVYLQGTPPSIYYWDEEKQKWCDSRDTEVAETVTSEEYSYEEVSELVSEIPPPPT